VAVSSAGPYANHVHLVPDTIMQAHHHSFFAGQMLFLMPNQQCPRTEGIPTTATLCL